jgi:FtsP/CotA-like multicopper oxidase with cupredoxin domain
LRSRTRDTLAALAALVALVGVSSLVRGGVPAAHAETLKVDIVNTSFVPPELSVAVGDTVTWTNKDPDTHSVVGGPMNSPDIPEGGSFSYTFAEAGDIRYSCRFHPYMEGVVHVGTGTGAAPPETGADHGADHAEGDMTAATTTTAPLPPPPRPAGTALGDGTHLAPLTTRADGVKVVHLHMTRVAWTVRPGLVKEAYTFNGTVPGPVIRVAEGDRVRIVVKNDLPIATGVHWHGMILPNAQDGVPGITQPAIRPGQTYVYEWTAVATGTHWYHAHSSGDDIGRGLYGVLEVVPKAGELPADRDYRLVVGDTNLGFVFNGHSFPATTRLAARVGERVHIRLVDAGDQSHPIHLHGMTFDVVAQDGIPDPHPRRMDTLLISPGQTFDIVATPTVEGAWLLHCHIFAHSHETTHDEAAMDSGTGGMTGLVTVLDVAPAPPPPPSTTAVTTTTPTTRSAPPPEPSSPLAASPAVARRSSSSRRTGVVLALALLAAAIGSARVATRRHATRRAGARKGGSAGA